MSFKLKSQVALTINAIILLGLGMFVFISMNKLEHIAELKSQSYQEIIKIKSIQQ